MAVYESDQHHGIRSVLKKWIPPIVLLVAALLAGQLFPRIHYTRDATWYILLTIFTIKALADIAVKTRINKVVIDVKDRKLLISYYDLVTGTMSEIYPFEKVRIQFDESKQGQVRRISVKAGKHYDYTISQKDGFSTYTLNELRNQLERLTSPVAS